MAEHEHDFGPVVFGKQIGPAHYETEIGPCGCGLTWEQYLGGAVERMEAERAAGVETVDVSVRWFDDGGRYIDGETRAVRRGSAELHALLAAWADRERNADHRVAFPLDAP